MQIKQFVENVKPSDGLPRLGKLHKGAKKQANRPGEDLSYFRLELEPQYAYLMPAWIECYGEQPTWFAPVQVLGITTDDAFMSAYEEWNATSLLHQCDGEQQHLHYNQQTAQYGKALIACAKDSDRPCNCTQVGRLNLLFMQFLDKTNVFGYIVAETHSIHDIITIYQTLRTAELACGSLKGVSLEFGRITKNISTPRPQKDGSIKRARTEKSLFYLQFDRDFVLNYMLPLTRQQPALPAPSTTFDVEQSKRLLGGGGGRRLVTSVSTGDNGGSDPDEGEIIEDGEQESEWTTDQLFERVKDILTSRRHFDNAFTLYLNNGVIHPRMSFVEAEAAIRLYRALEGKDERLIFREDKRREDFIGTAMDYVENDAAIIQALEAVANYDLGGVTGWRGCNYVALAAVLTFSAGYNPDQIRYLNFVEPINSVMRALCSLICRVVLANQSEAVAEGETPDERANRMLQEL